jgi:hypothetical protein
LRRDPQVPMNGGEMNRPARLSHMLAAWAITLAVVGLPGYPLGELFGAGPHSAYWKVCGGIAIVAFLVCWGLLQESAPDRRGDDRRWYGA